MSEPLLRVASAVAVCALSALSCSSNAKSDAGTSHDAAGTSAGGAAATSGGAESAMGGSPGSANNAGARGAAIASGGSNANNGSAGSAGASANNTAGSAGTSNVAGSPGAVWSGTFPTFTKHTIASFNAGYALAIADIDHDGMQDVIALSSGSAGLVWFKNPSWTKYTITSTTKQLIFTAPYDVNGDGHVDLALISDFDMNDTNGGGTVSWAEAPADPTKNQEWALHEIDAIPTSHRLRWADIDGDGKKELLD